MANGIEASENQEIKPSQDELQGKIVKQIEFYFGDYNLPKDKFLREKTSKSDGWLEIETLLTFNRLKTLTTDKQAVSDALKANKSELIELSEDSLKIRRNPEKPLPESFKEEFVNRTVYVKGFPQDMTLDALLEFFKPHGSGCVKMRRFPFNKQFKGSVFVLMETEEAAKKLRDTPELKYNDTVLVLKMAKEYADMKAAERGAAGKKKGDKKESKDAQDELKEISKTEEAFEKMEKKPGVFLKLTGLPKEGNITFQDIKTVFADCKVAFVDFEKGDETATVRFSEENGAKEAAEKLVKEGKISIKETELEAKVLEGEEETAQYRRQAEQKVARFNNDRNNRKRAGTNRHQGYRGQGGKRQRGGRRDGPQGKRAKTTE